MIQTSIWLTMVGRKFRTTGLPLWGTRRLQICLLVAVCALAGLRVPTVHAAAVKPPPMGQPPLASFPVATEGESQNFAMAQDADSIVYIGSIGGLLTFDGVRWRQHKLPNGDLVRSLVWDGRHRVYVGGYDLFGYVERDDTGHEVFTNMRPAFDTLLGDEPIGDIWRMLVAPEGVYFVAARLLLLYDPATGATHLWRHDGRFGAILRDHGETVVQFRGQGLMHRVGTDWQLLPGSEGLSSLAEVLLPTPQGGLLAISPTETWLEYRNGAVHQVNMPAGTPPPADFYRGRVLPDGRLLLSGEDGCLHVVDLRAGTHEQMQVSRSPLGDLVLARDGGVLVSTDLELVHVRWPSRWTVIGAPEGLRGSIYRVARLGERWVALSSQGVQILPDQIGDKVVNPQWTRSEAWDLVDLGQGEVLLAESYNLVLIQQGPHGAQRTDLCAQACYPRRILRSRFDPDIFLVGSEFGLQVFRHQGGQWQQLRGPEAEENLVVSMLETRAGEIWAGTGRSGVIRYRFEQGFDAPPQMRVFTAADGIAYGELSEADVFAMADGGVRVSTAKGFFEWRGTRFEASALGGLSALAPDVKLELIGPPGQETLASGVRRVFRRDPQQGWLSEPIQPLLRGGLDAPVLTADGTALWGMTDAILRYAPAGESEVGTPEVMLRGVTQRFPDGRERRLPLDSRFVADYGHFSLHFEFSLPTLDVDHRNDQYEVQMRREGSDDVPSGAWRSVPEVSFGGIDPGRYHFSVRAKRADGSITAPVGFDFTIRPPWYQTLWARVLASLLLTVFIVAAGLTMTWTRTRRLNLERARLEKIVAQRTRDLHELNQRLHDMANRDGLTQIANRRALDTYLAETAHVCAAQGEPLSALVIDIDHFKQHNDSVGHLEADKLLQGVGRALEHCAPRAQDLVARYGGDEFVVVLPATLSDAAEALAEAMRSAVLQQVPGVTISVGVGTRRPRPDEPPFAVLRAADSALYCAKRGGRNRVAVADESG